VGHALPALANLDRPGLGRVQRRLLAGYEASRRCRWSRWAPCSCWSPSSAYATEEKDKRKLRKAFQLYLNPEVMEEMLEQPQNLQLGGKEMDSP